MENNETAFASDDAEGKVVDTQATDQPGSLADAMAEVEKEIEQAEEEAAGLPADE